MLLFEWLAMLGVVLASSECEVSGEASLDLSRWRVSSRPDMAHAAGLQLYGGFQFEAHNGREGYPLNFAMVEGVPWPHPLDQSKYEESRRTVRLRANDVVVATYPKSGTTWVEQVVLLLVHGSKAAAMLHPEHRNTFSPKTGIGKFWLEPMLAGKRRSSLDVAAFDAVPSPRVVKSHAPFRMLLGIPTTTTKALDKSGAKVVYVARNAKDAAVSLYYQRAPVSGGQRVGGGAKGRHRLEGRRRLTTNNTTTAGRMPMDAWCALYLGGYVSCGSYFDHVAQWHAASRRSKAILFLTYEDMTRDPRGTIQRIADHLGLHRTPAEVRAVQNASTFEAMSSRAAANRGGAGRQRRQARYAVAPGTSVADASAAAAGHFRQGRVGAWRSHFNAKLDAQFDATYHATFDAAAKRAAADFGVPHIVPRFDFGCDQRGR